MTAYGPKADMTVAHADVRFGPHTGHLVAEGNRSADDPKRPFEAKGQAYPPNCARNSPSAGFIILL